MQTKSYLDSDPSVNWANIWVPRVDISTSSSSTSSCSSSEALATPNLENSTLNNDNIDCNVDFASNLFKGLGVSNSTTSSYEERQRSGSSRSRSSKQSKPAAKKNARKAKEVKRSRRCGDPNPNICPTSVYPTE